MRGTWVDPADDPREGRPPAHGERAVLLDYLWHYRTTFAMKLEGLDAEQLARRSVPPSTMSLLGLLRHLAKVEFSWFRNVMGGDEAARPFADTDVDFDGAVADEAVVAEAWDLWRGEVAHAETFVEQAVDLEVEGSHHGTPIALRDVLVHLVEEYARHVGHADLLRECIDGRTGQ